MVEILGDLIGLSGMRLRILQNLPMCNRGKYYPHLWGNEKIWGELKAKLFK